MDEFLGLIYVKFTYNLISKKQEALINTLQRIPEVARTTAEPDNIKQLNTAFSNMTTSSTSGGPVKVKPYKGDRTSLEPFLAMCELYFIMNTQFDTDNKKVMFVGAQLEEGPLQWFTPILQDYLQNRSHAKEENKNLFANYRGFLRIWASKRTFGVKGAAVTSLLASKNLLNPGNDLVARGI